MAVAPKHTDPYAHYEPDKDLTLDQLHRFTQTANHAQKKREELQETEELSPPDSVRRARRKALMKILSSKPTKPHTIRYLIWLIVSAVMGLWGMYVLG